MTGAVTTHDGTKTEARCGESRDLVWSAPLAMAAIAHEIRNPLLSVSANMELLRDQLDGHDPRRRCVDRALSEVDRLSGVVDRLVDFAATHRPQLERRRVVEFFEDQLTRERAGWRGADGFGPYVIEFDPSAVADVRRCLVDLDAKLLGRVVSNLVRNAVESMAEGGRLRVSLDVSREDEVVVVFEDEGVGIASGFGERIFEPFVTTKPDGTGLGLPFSRRIARVHGGDLRAVEQRGGRFELVLPLARGAAKGSAE